jgi:lysophospholipase L1-like esterase
MRRIAVATVLLFAACAPSGVASSPPLAAPPTMLSEARAALATVTTVTALGDSVPDGTACDCTPYPLLSGSDLERALGHHVGVDNDAVPGTTSVDVLRQIQQDSGTVDDVANSQAVLVEVGANDVAYSAQCGTDASCYAAEVPNVTKNLRKVVDRLHALTSAHPVAVVLLDYWSVWLGGQYETAQGSAYVEAAEDVTTSVNDAIRSVARDTGSIYVDVRTAFRGANNDDDETHLLAPDGDHPNAAGHRRIADAVAAAVNNYGASSASTSMSRNQSA